MKKKKTKRKRSFNRFQETRKSKPKGVSGWLIMLPGRVTRLEMRISVTVIVDSRGGVSLVVYF